VSGRPHPLGSCDCRSHADRPWRRPEHWSAAEVAHLESRFGLAPDATIARRLGRTVTGVRLKAKRLGLLKRDAGLTGREVAAACGVHDKLPARWEALGLLRSTRAYRQGPHRVRLFAEAELLRFLRGHGEWVDASRMPDSAYRDAALEGGRWLALPDVARLTERHTHTLAREVREGRWPARRRGPAWAIHESVVAAMPRGRASWPRREATLQHRRDVRKGIAAPRAAGRPPGSRQAAAA
jgi:hypothetical protein